MTRFQTPNEHDRHRAQLEDQLREMKRQRTSLARQVGSQQYSDERFSAINNKINNIEYSLREQYGYGLTDASDFSCGDMYEQQAGETGEEFLTRLLAEDPFAPPMSSAGPSSSTALPTVAEEDEEDVDDSEEEDDAFSVDRKAASCHPSPSTNPCTSSGPSPSMTPSFPSSSPSPSASDGQPTAAAQGAADKARPKRKAMADCEIVGVRKGKRDTAGPSPSEQKAEPETKRQRVGQVSALDVVLEEPSDNEAGVSSVVRSPVVCKPKARVKNGLDAIFMQTPLPTSGTTKLQPGSAPVGRNPMVTPLSAVAKTTRPSAGSFFSRMWGRIRSFSKGPSDLKFSAEV